MMIPSPSGRNRRCPGRVSVGQFGDKFKEAREKRGLSLDDVSNVTKIGSRMLQAIEEEHFDQLPGGVFNKGFIRAYAKHLGLNDQEAVTEYLACLRQAQIDAQAAWNPQARPPAPEKRPLVSEAKPSAKAIRDQPPPPREELPELQLPKAEHVRPPRPMYPEMGAGIPWRIVAVAGLVVVLGIVWWSRRSHTAHPETTASAAPVPSSTSVQPAPSPVSAPASAQKTAPEGGNAVTSAPPSASKPQPSPVTPSAPEAPHSATRNALAEQTNPAGASALTKNAGETTEDTASTPVPQSPASQPPGKSAALMTLVIRASENSWISVTADGQPVSQETLIAPAQTSIRASHEIVVKAGNAAGVSFLWNGKEIAAEGGEAEVKTFVFDSGGMRVVSTAQPATQNP